VVSLFGAVGAEASGSSATSARALVGLRTTALGAVLVDARGRTLYLFEKDRKGKSSCTGACAAFWPPLVTVGKPAAGRGVKASLLGTTRRGDGRLQVTYNRHPLYTFSLDKKAGQTKGEELSSFGGSWYAVSAKGVKVEKAESSGGGSYGGGSGGGGYGP
jgi:predicted lipoprotein with Yx(FWY)xxD motif